MQFSFLLKGVLIGFLASMPLGPISIVIIQRTINRNRLAGFYSGIGAALSDSVYATVAGLSMVLIISFIRENELIFKVVGSGVLLALGIFIFLSHPERYARKNGKKKNSPLKDLISTCLLTLSNPLVIFIHLAIFSGFEIVLNVNKPGLAVLFMSGFLFGAIIWWFTLTGLINLFRRRFSLKICLWFNRIAGAAIVVFVLVSFLFTAL